MKRDKKYIITTFLFKELEAIINLIRTILSAIKDYIKATNTYCLEVSVFKKV